MDILHSFPYIWELQKLFYPIFNLKQIIIGNWAINYLFTSKNKKNHNVATLSV